MGESNFSNYSHNSLLPAISKISVKDILAQPYDFFQREKLFCSGPYDFRNKHFSETNTLHLL